MAVIGTILPFLNDVFGRPFWAKADLRPLADRHRRMTESGLDAAGRLSFDQSWDANVGSADFQPREDPLVDIRAAQVASR